MCFFHASTTSHMLSKQSLLPSNVLISKNSGLEKIKLQKIFHELYVEIQMALIWNDQISHYITFLYQRVWSWFDFNIKV